MSARAHSAWGRGPLCAVLMDFPLVVTRARSPRYTLWAALVGADLQHFSLRKGTLRVFANNRFADHNITMATTVLA